MKLILFLCLVLHIYTVSAQTTEVTGGKLEIAVFTPNFDSSDGNAEGSPYTKEEFIPAKLDYLDKTQFIRFNVVDDIIELRSKAGTSLMLDLRKDFKIELLDGSDASYLVGEYAKEGVANRSFFEIVLQTESFSIFKKERKKYIKKEKAEAFKEAKPAQFIDVADLFYITDFKSNSKVLLEFPKKKKKFIAFFEKKGKAVEKFMKQENLDFKKQDDLIEIMNFVFSNSQ